MKNFMRLFFRHIWVVIVAVILMWVLAPRDWYMAKDLTPPKSASPASRT